MTISMNAKRAGLEYWLMGKEGKNCFRFTDAKYAPSGGPTVKPNAKDIPTQARFLDRSLADVMSEMIAIDICTLPSVNPPTILDQMKTPKDPENIHRSIDSPLPSMLRSNTVRRPYRSLNCPMTGLLINCRNENRDPMKPPNRIISSRDPVPPIHCLNSFTPCNAA